MSVRLTRAKKVLIVLLSGSWTRLPAEPWEGVGVAVGRSTRVGVGRGVGVGTGVGVGVGAPTVTPALRNGSMFFTALIGIARPMPSIGLPPDSSTLAVMIPTTSPLRSINGPPLFPGFIGESIWTNSRSPIRRCAETTPFVTEGVRPSTDPNGYPIATTSSPCANRLELPKGSTGRSPARVNFITAMSKSTSLPITVPVLVTRPPRMTSTVVALPTTWLLVRIQPASSKMKPEPSPESVRMSTTAGVI